MLLAGSIAMYAQSVVPTGGTAEDYIKLLNASGYEAYAFHFDGIDDNVTFDIRVEIKEYVGRNPEAVASTVWSLWPSRRVFSEVPARYNDNPEEFAKLKAASYDPDRGIYCLNDRLTLGFRPSDSDSTARAFLSVENEIVSSTRILKLRPVETPWSGRGPIFRYDSRPFKASPFAFDTFIPLVLYCSYWYDSQYNVVRCCGEREISPELTSEILENAPHYFIIGVTFCRR